MATIDIQLANGDKAGETLKQLTHQASALRKELGGLKPGTEEFIKAAKSFNTVEDKLKDVKEQVKQTTSASDLLKKGWNSLPGAGFFNNITNSLGMMKQGVGGLISSMGVLKGAIAATGIGLIVIVIATLVTLFSKTEEGADLIARAMAILDAIFRQYIESVKRLFSLDIVGFFKGMTIEMVAQVKAADDLAIAIDNLEEKESAFQVVQKAGMRDKAELLKMTKDETVAIEDKIKAIDKAMGITKALNETEIENQRERLKIISGGNQVISDELIKDLERTGVNMDNKKKFFKKGNITQDDLNEVNQALGRFLEIQQSAFDEERELLTQRTKLTKKEKAETTKDTKDASKEEKDARDAYLKALAIQLEVEQNLRKLNNERTLLLIDDARKRETEKLEQDTQEKIIALQGSDMQIFEQTKILREIQGLELAAINKKFDDKQIEENKKKNDILLKQQQELAAARMQLDMDEAALKFDVVGQMVAFGANYFASQQRNEEDAKRIRKRGAIIEIGINLMKELSLNRLAAAAAAAATGGILAPAAQAKLAFENTRARINAAFAIGSVMAFKHGGDTGYGNINDVAGVVHKKEYVVPAWMNTNPKLSGVMGMLEGIRTNGFQAGGPVNPFDNSRGPVSSGNAATSASTLIDYNMLGKVIANEMKDSIARIQVENNVQDTEGKLKVLNKLRNEADV